jgi:hypothetical protein
VKANWTDIAKVHIEKLGGSQCAHFADMRSTWNPTREISWRRIDEILFTTALVVVQIEKHTSGAIVVLVQSSDH